MTADGTCYAKQLLNLVAIGGQTTTYQVKATFEGTNFKTRNLTIADPYGRGYAVCTTLQWDFKSSHNSVTLTVEAPKTDATVSQPASPEDAAFKVEEGVRELAPSSFEISFPAKFVNISKRHAWQH